MNAALILLVAIGCVTGILWWWNRIDAHEDEPDETLFVSDTWDLGDDDAFSLSPDAEAFALRLGGTASLSKKQLPLTGRLQIHVASGSQYATWRQFPSTIQYEVRHPSGDVSMTPDLTLSISDDPTVHDRYAKEPSDRVVGQNFDTNVFDLVFDGLFTAPAVAQPGGAYQIRAHYMGKASNWVDVELGA